MSQTISPSLKYDPSRQETISFAGGCFWGTEKLFKQFIGNGVEDLKVGYANGNSQERESLSYEEVCKGDTDYAEVVQLSYDKSSKTLKELVQFFFKIHDPTTKDKQGHDNGTQYRSAIFYSDPSQLPIIKQVIEEYNPKWDNKIVTVVEEITRYYDAEDYHQNYFEGELHAERQWPECENHYIRDI